MQCTDAEGIWYPRALSVCLVVHGMLLNDGPGLSKPGAQEKVTTHSVPAQWEILDEGLTSGEL